MEMDDTAIINQLFEIYKNDKDIHIKNEDNFKTKLKKLIKDGRKSIQIVTDFDMTITKYWKDGKRTPTSHCIISENPLLPEDVVKRSEELINKYYPYEISNEISYEEKYQYMVEWWTKQHDIIIEQKLTQESLNELIKAMPVVFRDGFEELFEICKSNGIPMLIPSAGIQNVIEGVFKQNKLEYEKLCVKSNQMLFSPKTGTCDAFSEPVIHSLNKYQFNFKGTPYEKYIIDRKNILLFGDSLGDIAMSKTIDHEQVISFGFLNIDVDKKLENFMNVFDVVITNDSSFNFGNAIIKLLKE
ncbi:HAD-superfamily hydrolase [Anaeromyces robustus]|uniref:5'-nucleotidase n=1 Tax=Anaeromyces robustus TaxID=1754192 RepID=A0A1Y1X9F6_9FUNG|nr:HAD-superfamily hydrolase [Anaeromyces robustus]|eukprot:ORX82383.1 HAD-superfamily hydrolase [Anaeromyces robustus]